MALTIEWRRRIDNWRKELPRHFYYPLGEVVLSGFTTLEQLRAAEALSHEFAPMPPGTPWGAKWEYGWFKGQLTLPDRAAGERIVLRVEIGAESIVFVDGKAAGARDQQHTEIALSEEGVPGAVYDILVEGYAGHGPRVEYAGPTPPGRETVPEPPAAQTSVGETTFGIWQEDVYQLWIDVETLYELRDAVDQNSLRVMEIDEGLRDFTRIVDFELSREQMLATVRACRSRLRRLLDCKNGSTAPFLYAFGHSHIDVAWLWPLAETERKAGRTLSTQLALMDEYPEYRFLFGQPHLYRMIRERYPEIYERMKDAAERGQIVPEGGMWVQADTNVSGGEALIRQFVHGKRFFQDEFGVDCKLMWLPDVFGYSGALPQIMRGCGIPYFSTAKIFWAYNGGDPFPYNTFTWEGIDGSEVLVHLCNDYNSEASPAFVADRWNGRVQKNGISSRLMPFGYGDGGGGPTRDHLEFLRRERDLEGLPRVTITSPVEFFKDQESSGVPDARYVGELYFQAHRGTYTSQAKTKRGNRKSELALREAEIWSVAAAAQGYKFPRAALGEAWKLVLLNQFHDILPGSSIQRVYEEAERSYAEAIATAERTTAQALDTLTTDNDSAITVFNSLSWERTVLVALGDGVSGAAGASSQPLPVQQIGDQTWAEVSIPACGWTTVRPAVAAETSSSLTCTPGLLENEHLRLLFNASGEITSIFDKDANRELAAGACNSFKMYKDVPTGWDAWDVDSMLEDTPVRLDEAAQVEVITTGPLVARLRVSRALNQSPMTQEISLRHGSRCVEFKTTVDWRESHKLLKVTFPVDIHTNEAIHEIQFGHIRRPNHHSRPFDADRFEVSAHKWTALAEEARGCAVLNDSKYGVSVLGSSINLTLLKSPLAPDMTADKGIQNFTYAFTTWNDSLSQSPVVRQAYELNCPVVTAAGAAGESSLFDVDAPNVIIDTVKPAEDGSGDVILRLYESKRTATTCTLATSLPAVAVAQTDMLENEQASLVIDDGHAPLDFRPFEVKTLRLRLG